MQLLVMIKQEHIDLRSLLRLQTPGVESRRENHMTCLFSWSEARRPRHCSPFRLRLFLAISHFLATAGVSLLRLRIWDFNKGERGDWGGVSRDSRTWSKQFFYFFQTREIDPVLPIVTEFYRVLSILNEFNRFRVFNSILYILYKIKLYNFTSK